MPRLSPSLLLKAYHISPFLPLVLQGTRTLDSAINELRWMKEHVSISTKPSSSLREQGKELLGLCVRRARAEPLQYILGSQPFGELEIRCRRGVLIPRPETEAYTTHVANLISDDKIEKLTKSKSLKILDVCSGSGCISLLLHSLLAPKFKDISVVGVDISPNAIALARENLSHNIKQGNLLAEANSQVQFEIKDVLDSFPHGPGSLDIIISNPPYISPKKFITETSRSVRNYEPSLALVPFYNPSPNIRPEDRGDHEPEDVFYQRLLDFFRIHASQLLVMEVGDEEQAKRVVQMAITKFQKKIREGTVAIEVWRDWPAERVEVGEEAIMRMEGNDFTAEVMDISEIGFKEGLNPARAQPERAAIPALDIPIMGTGAIRTVVLFRMENFKERGQKKEPQKEIISSTVLK